MTLGIGAEGLREAMEDWYTEGDLGAMIPGSRQNRNKRIHFIRGISGVEVRGLWFYRKLETDRYFEEFREMGLSRYKPKTQAQKQEQA